MIQSAFKAIDSLIKRNASVMKSVAVLMDAFASRLSTIDKCVEIVFLSMKDVRNAD